MMFMFIAKRLATSQELIQILYVFQYGVYVYALKTNAFVFIFEVSFSILSISLCNLRVSGISNFF